jgi:hypothetical protein
MVERSQPLAVRVLMMFTAMVGIYPQVRSLRTIMTAMGWLPGSWEAMQLVNERKIFILEPVAESLVQVFDMILHF